MANSRIIKECGSCNSPNLDSVVFLGYHQLACTMPKVGEQPKEEPHYPLELMSCGDCGLMQLSCVVDPKVVFHPEYPYSSGNTRALWDDFSELAAELAPILEPNDLIVDIGGNDGTLLRCFPETLRRVAVDPTDQVQSASHHGIKSHQMFFSLQAARSLRAFHDPAKVITACNVMAHVADIHDVLEGVVELLAPDGVFVAENHDLSSIIDGMQWDTIYHEHLRFYSVASWADLLQRHGLYVYKVESIGTHGGSFRAYASRRPIEETVESAPEDTRRFAQEVEDTRTDIRQQIRFAQSRGRVVGIGAAARAATVIQYCGLTADDIDVVCEVPTSDKIGRYMPGTLIPVVDEAMLIEEQPETAVLFSWHVAKYIIPSLRQKGYTGDIIVPLPTVTIDHGENR